MVQSSKGRTRPAPATLGDFLPPGISQIEPSNSLPKNEVAPFGGPYTEEFAKIEEALEGSLSDREKRELALERAISANVPWRKGRSLSKMASPTEEKQEPKSIFKFGAAYNRQCSCGESNCTSLHLKEKGVF